MKSPKAKGKDREIIIARSDGEDESFSSGQRLRFNSGSSSSSSKKKSKTLHPPIETHWHLPTPKERKRASFSIKMLSYPLMKLGRSKSMEMVLEGTRDPNDAQIVESFREMLSRENLLPPKHNDYHTLLRYRYVSICFLLF